MAAIVLSEKGWCLREGGDLGKKRSEGGLRGGVRKTTSGVVNGFGPDLAEFWGGGTHRGRGRKISGEKCKMMGNYFNVSIWGTIWYDKEPRKN